MIVGTLLITSTVLELTTLDLSSKNISNLQGIETFTGLQHLNLDNNNLSTLNVSENTNLLTLDVGRNNLTNLDITTLTQLTSVKAFGNALTVIDLSQSPVLEVFNAGSNQLTAIDISNNPRWNDWMKECEEAYYEALFNKNKLSE